MMHIWRNDPADQHVVILAVTMTGSGDDPLARNVLDMKGNILCSNPTDIDASLPVLTFTEWVDSYFTDLDRYKYPPKSIKRTRMLKALLKVFESLKMDAPMWLRLEANVPSEKGGDPVQERKEIQNDAVLAAFRQMPKTVQDDCHPKCGKSHPTKSGPHIHYAECKYRQRVNELQKA